MRNLNAGYDGRTRGLCFVDSRRRRAPLADTSAVASIGLMQVIADPRMTVAQSLHAIHVAELADTDGWQLLIKLARHMGQDDIADRFQTALEEQICLDEAGVR